MKYTVNELVELINSELLPTYNDKVRKVTLEVLIKKRRKSQLPALLRAKNVS